MSKVSFVGVPSGYWGWRRQKGRSGYTIRKSSHLTSKLLGCPPDSSITEIQVTIWFCVSIEIVGGADGNVDGALDCTIDGRAEWTVIRVGGYDGMLAVSCSKNLVQETSEERKSSLSSEDSKEFWTRLLDAPWNAISFINLRLRRRFISACPEHAAISAAAVIPVTQ